MKTVFIVHYNVGPGVGHAWPATPDGLEELADLSPAARRHRVDVMREIMAGRFTLATYNPGERWAAAVVGSGRVVGPGRIIDGEGRPSALAGCNNATGCPLAAVCMRADPRHGIRFNTGRGELPGCWYAMPGDPAHYRQAVESTNSNENNPGRV